MSPALDTLPPEILFNILSFTSPFSTSLLPKHPLYTVAATSSHLRNVVEEYSRSLLKRHADITPPITFKPGTFAYRRRWVRWVKETCQKCGRLSRRKAILEPGLTCCNQCDRGHYPKMTQTKAIKIHRLSKLDLFTPNALHPDLPPLVFGSYVCMGGDTLMLSTPSVLERKAYIYGQLGEEKTANTDYMRRRTAAHDRLIKHMGIAFRVRGGKGTWVGLSHIQSPEGSDTRGKVPKSMASKEARDHYVRLHIEEEQTAMGMNISGRLRSNPIEVD